ncbi:hypothetical protein CcCBS67573_g08217 [Chytriomyces confervae]|uniref:Uncharacterized protein n=1 Tax=Chytriomyces confervae TaxID=246404 RepID=A0A507EMT8_9FUNG|nr:hypothetical protein HDU80_002896 [Chytriomyces hyalinus]TPX65151.1 hypothetical protein CcCBS67573_g08217 [Chytriomyces confervae]
MPSHLQAEYTALFLQDTNAVHISSVSGTKNYAFPPSILEVNSLESVTITFSRLEGSLPQHLDSCFRSLHTLNLSANALTGSIPDGIGNLVALQTLDLCDNYFSGNIPGHCLARLKRLKRLNFAGNHLTGIVPAELASMSQLISLRLEGNRLSGCIPTIWSSSLEEVSLSRNNLAGTIPPALIALPMLKWLEVDCWHFDSVNLPNETRLVECLRAELRNPSDATSNILGFGIENSDTDFDSFFLEIRPNLTLSLCSVHA